MPAWTVAPAIPGFTGQVIAPGHHDYEPLRRVWNALHDRRPALLARCATPADVAAAIAYGRRHQPDDRGPQRRTQPARLQHLRRRAGH